MVTLLRNGNRPVAEPRRRRTRPVAETRPAPALPGDATADVLRRLELTVTRRLDGMLQGDYRGLVPGHGSELGETRAYQPGDDVRRIDWNVTARTQSPQIRQTIADRELETWILTDLSASLGFGTARCEKRDLALAAAAAVGHLTARSGNRVGAVTLAGPTVATHPAHSGRLHLQALLHRLATTSATDHPGSSDLAGGLQRLSRTMRHRGLAVVISDFLTPPPTPSPRTKPSPRTHSAPPARGLPDWQRPLHLLATRHETLVVEVVDPRELALPAVGRLDVFDPETGDHREIDTGNPKVRAAYAAAAADQRAAIAYAVRQAGADHLVLSTDGDWLADLVRFVARRRERMDARTRSKVHA